jgi:hypothetical protein
MIFVRLHQLNLQIISARMENIVKNIMLVE